MNLWNIAHLWTLHIYVLEFARLQNFCRFSKFGKLLTLPPDGRHRRLRRRNLPMWSRSNTESVFCRKLSKIYPPCQNPDRSSYRLLNRLARRARVVHQMKRAVWSKTLICRAEQYGSLMGQRPQELLGALLAPCHCISAISAFNGLEEEYCYRSQTTGSDGVSFLLPQLFFSQQRLKIRK